MNFPPDLINICHSLNPIQQHELKLFGKVVEIFSQGKYYSSTLKYKWMQIILLNNNKKKGVP